MAQRGAASKAHVYDKNGACIHCGMYRTNVERSCHVCTAQRELAIDIIEAAKAEMSVEDYRRNDR